MSYKNILWIKLEKRLLNDYRFYSMSEDSQLLYVKLLLLSAETTNKIPKDTQIIRSLTRSSLTNIEMGISLKEIQKNFPKFKSTRGFYYFQEWDYKHNFIAKGVPEEIPSNSAGVRREDKIREDKNRIDKNSERQAFAPKIMSKLQEIINYYLEITGKDESEFKKHLRPAKELLQLCDDDIELAQKILRRCNNEAVGDWSIYWACKKYLEFK